MPVAYLFDKFLHGLDSWHVVDIPKCKWDLYLVDEHAVDDDREVRKRLITRDQDYFLAFVEQPLKFTYADIV